MSNVPPPPADPYDPNFVPQYSGGLPQKNTLALLALIFGLCGIIGCIPLGLAGLVIGIVALVRVNQNPQLGRKAFAITGVVLGGLSCVVVPVLALLIAILIPSLGRARELAMRAQCSANLHAVMQSMMLYGAENGGAFPCVNGPESANTYRVQSAQLLGSSGTASDALKDMQSGSNRDLIASPTAGLWMLVLRGQTAPHNYLCRSDGFAGVPAHLQSGANFYEDFGPQNISYAIAYPWMGAKAGPWYKDNTDSTCLYLSDMPPLNGDVYSGVTVAVESANAPGANRRAYNSPNHNGEGQNVAFGDVHVEWHPSPVCGPTSTTSQDNIFTASGGPAGPDPKGLPPTPGRLGGPLSAETAPYDIEVVPSRKSDGTTQ